MVKPGHEEEFIDAWGEMSAWTMRELVGESSAAQPGRLLRDRTDPTRFISFGPWESIGAIEAWRAHPGFARMREMQDPRIDCPHDTRRCHRHLSRFSCDGGSAGDRLRVVRVGARNVRWSSSDSIGAVDQRRGTLRVDPNVGPLYPPSPVHWS
jgi:heme-degrading monooxygenase HmoA